MWSQSSSDKQTYPANERSILGADSGFESGNSEIMRDCSGVTDIQLSETLLRNIQMKHSHINNLEAARTHQQRLQEHQQNIPSAVLPSNMDQLADKQLNANNVKCEKIDRLQNGEILKQGYESFYTQDDDGDTHLHISIAMKHVEASMWLIGQAPHPCLLDIANDDMETALHLAVMVSEPLLVRRLLLAGTNPRLRTRSGDTALHIACARGDLACAKALTEPLTPAERSWLAGRPPVLAHNLELRNYEGKTCLHIAAANGHVKLVDQLVRSGANVETQEGLGGKTALHLAVLNNCREVVRWLLRECRSCIDKTTYAGYTAYQFAVEMDGELAEELLSFGASPELADSDSSCCGSSSSSSSSSSSGSDTNDSSSDEECELAGHFVRLPVDGGSNALGV